jgi:hypothetical protein
VTRLALAIALIGCGAAPAPEPAHADPMADARPAVVRVEPEARENPPPEPDDLPAPSDVAGVPADATIESSGLASRVLRAGAGTVHPSATSTVRVHYTGWTTNGHMFDSSVVRGEPVAFPLGSVIRGWTEGVQLMVVGEQRRFWIPGRLAYGDHPRNPGHPAGLLVFDIELLGIEP